MQIGDVDNTDLGIISLGLQVLFLTWRWGIKLNGFKTNGRKKDEPLPSCILFCNSGLTVSDKDATDGSAASLAESPPSVQARPSCAEFSLCLAGASSDLARGGLFFVNKSRMVFCCTAGGCRLMSVDVTPGRPYLILTAFDLEVTFGFFLSAGAIILWGY